jgi:lipid-binding SYLF domain-containing protein
MKALFEYHRWLYLAVTAVVLGLSNDAVYAASSQQINREADAALATLYETTPVAKKLAAQAVGVLIFPSIVKAGLVIGGQYGEGVLRQNGKSTGYFSSSAVSYGLQVGAQSFGYVMFLMTDDAIKYLDRSDGWEVGVGPSLVIVDDGIAKTLTTSTIKNEIYAFVFGQQGLMAGLAIEGSKITKINPRE